MPPIAAKAVYIMASAMTIPSPSPQQPRSRSLGDINDMEPSAAPIEKKKASDHRPPALIQKLFSGFLKQDSRHDVTNDELDPKMMHVNVNAKTDNEEEDLSHIESSNDISMLMDGVANDVCQLTVFWQRHDSEKDDDGVSSHKPKASMDPESASHSKSALRMLAARLSRVKYLLYQERSSLPSLCPSSKSFCTNAGFVLDALIQPRNLHECGEGETCKVGDSSSIIILTTLLHHLYDIPFEARKDVASIFNYLLVCGCIESDANCNIVMDNGIIVPTTLGEISGGGPFHHFHRNSQEENQLMEYAATMVEFVSFIEQNFGELVTEIVHGHFVRREDEAQKLTSSSSSATIPPVVTKTDVALHYGSMLRSILRHPTLYSLFTSEDYASQFAYPFLESLVNQPNFEVASDALETLRTITTGCVSDGEGYCAAVVRADMTVTNESMTISLTTAAHDSQIAGSTEQESQLVIMTNPIEIENMMGSIASSFLERDYERIFEERFNSNLLSTQNANYITRRVGLQLLSTILLTRSNYSVMMKYISNRANLRTIMMLLRDPGAQITLEAFHVFKVFVANPNKTPEVCRILIDNKAKLVNFIAELHKELEMNDEQFREEKNLVLSTLHSLQDQRCDR